MKTLTVGFSRPRKSNWFSKAIQAVDETKFSHVYIRFNSDKFGRELIYQASHLQVNFFGGALFDAKNETLHRFDLEVDDDTFARTITYAIDHAGVPYGIGQVFGILYVKVLSKFGITVKNPFSNGRSAYLCSELVAEILSNFTQLELKGDLDLITPKMVFEAISEYVRAKES